MSSALALAVRRLVAVVVAAGATTSSVGWPSLSPQRILFVGSGSGSGSGAVVVGAFVPHAILRVGLLASAGSWSVDSEDFVVIHERCPGSALDAVGFGCAGGSGIASFFALLTDLAGAGVVSLNRATLVLKLNHSY
jgi:hypothetical protein